MTKIEIVTHVYCPPGVDQYAHMLRYQAASLLHWPADPHVQLSVLYCPQDRSTTDVVYSLSMLQFPPDVQVVGFPLEPGQLFRRAIGRNMRALATDADVVWFTDVDYFFGQHCLDDVATLVHRNSGLCIPATIQIHKDHQTGADEVRRTRGILAPKADLTQFVERRQKIAIGGVQIVGGDLARRIGYLDGTAWVQPVDPAAGFRSCKCDHAWRRHNQLDATRLPIRSCYRMRHEQDGRDYTRDGTMVGKAVW